ncbi:hypothetical protein GEMRC1_013037 [Eukaryota sp. GEM-RC1]
MKVVKKRLDNVVSKAKVKFIESRVKRAHQVRVRSTLFLKHFCVHNFQHSGILGYIQKLLPATVPNVTVKEEMNSDTDESTDEETDVHSESIDATAPPVKVENIEDVSGEPEPDLWTRIQTTKIELPNWKNFFTLKSMEQVLSMMTIRDERLVNNQNHIRTVQESLTNIISNTNDGSTQNQFAQHFLMHYIPRLELAADSVGLDRIVFPSSHRLSPILHYMATEIITNYKNNMSEHFHEYVFQVFNLVTLKKIDLTSLLIRINDKSCVQSLMKSDS